MVRSFAAIAVVLTTASALPIAGRGIEQSAPGNPVLARAVDALIDRADSTAPGTFMVSERLVLTPADPLPVLLQADVLRGGTGQARVALVLGAEVPQAAMTRLRAFSKGGATASRVVDVGGSAQAGRLRSAHEVVLSPGTYELHAVVGHISAGGDVIATLVKSQIAVPDVWHGTLALTPIVLGDGVAAAARAEALPFSFGPTALDPATKIRFRPDERVHVAFRVYNWGKEPDAEPDLTAEYAFYQQGANRLLFFNKLKPQILRRDMLGERFDISSGSVAAGMSVPLTAFPYGEFELRVRVTGNQSKESAEQRVRFVVTP